MTRTHVLVAGAVAVLAATALLFGSGLREESRGAPPAAAGSGSRLESGFAAGNTSALVADLQATLRRRPNARSFGLLGLAYQQRARETGDPAYYSKAEGALRRALALSPGDLTATSGLGALALSRHRFLGALRLGRRALALSPTATVGYGITGDALVELGRYGEAFRAFDTFARLRPGVASYARVSYARELLGRPRAAAAAMRLALDAATGAAEPTAWVQVQLGKLAWSVGRIGAAASAYRAALAAFPNYVYALDGLAQVDAAHGNLGRAIALEQRAADRIPLPQFVATLGDLYAAAGNPRAARRRYALIDAIQRLLTANGVRTDLETALFDVDHGRGLRGALVRARAAHAERPSIDGDDVLAWALARNGKCGEALAYSRHALRLGTLDALKFFHRGMVEQCVGHRAAGRMWLRRALALNPHFSIRWAPVAREALR